MKLDDSRQSAFLIQDMFPITDEYIERAYTRAGNHLMLTSEHTAKEVEQKAKKVMGMLKRCARTIYVGIVVKKKNCDTYMIPVWSETVNKT